jgi:hypothetical protein
VEGSGCGLILGTFPNICLEGLTRTTKGLSDDRRSPDQDLNPVPTEYETGMLNTRPQCSVAMVTSEETPSN